MHTSKVLLAAQGSVLVTTDKTHHTREDLTMKKLLKFAVVAAAALAAITLIPAGWPFAVDPDARFRAENIQLARLEDRIRLERDVASRADDNARQVRTSLDYLRRHQYPLAVVLEWDETLTRAEQAAMAKREIVTRSEEERRALSERIAESGKRDLKSGAGHKGASRERRAPAGNRHQWRRVRGRLLRTAPG